MVQAERTTEESAIFGWLLVGGSILATAFALIHPEVTSTDLAGVLHQMAAHAVFNGWVHGILIALYLVLVAGFYGLSRQLGFGRPLVVLAMVFYSAGVLAMMSAAVINGFAFGMFAGRYAQFPSDHAAAIGSSINLAGTISATWAGIGATATSAAIVAWSCVMLNCSGVARVIGGSGIILGIATAFMLVTGTLILNVHGFLLLVVTQAIWTIVIGLQLARGRV
jgi:hypothetical protein